MLNDLLRPLTNHHQMHAYCCPILLSPLTPCTASILTFALNSALWTLRFLTSSILQSSSDHSLNGCPDLGATLVNTMLGNVKNAMHGTYHALRPKYLERYLSEFCYRSNRRFDLAALAPRLIVAATRTPPMSYRLATLDV